MRSLFLSCLRYFPLLSHNNPRNAVRVPGSESYSVSVLVVSAGEADHVQHHTCLRASACKLLRKHPPCPHTFRSQLRWRRPAARSPTNHRNTRVGLNPPPPAAPQNHAAAAANVKFTERKARERAAAHCSTCMR